jgi:2-polyprenyl-3-methyl-5-hydroxy-6-metoxy-1,4-benzoquinol methylase
MNSTGMNDSEPGYPYRDAARADVQRLVPAGVKSLLDVGCGTGLFGRDLLATRPEIEVWGIDPQPTVAATATGHLTRFVSGYFPDDLLTSDAQQRFDCITFNDSLEHFADPWQVLRQTRELLSEGGVVVASIPNVRNYGVIRRLVCNGEWEYKDTGIMDRTHLRFFTRKSATEMFAACGFRVSETVALNVANNGRAVRALAIFGRRSVEFRALQFAYVAHLL